MALRWGAARSGTTVLADSEPQALGEAFFREGRSGDVAAITEETHLATELKQRAASSPSALYPIPLR